VTPDRSHGRRPAAILDVDGTLVDSNYHHALAWFRALRRHGVTVPIAVIHRHIGMGGDQIVAAMAGRAVEERLGDAVREAEGECFREIVDEIVALPGARDLLQRLRGAGLRTVLASSAKAWEVERYVDILGARGVVGGWTDSADVEATKPEPDLVLAALEKAGGRPAVLVGDSVWDCRAAGRAGVPVIGVLTGGVGEAELRGAGAVHVLPSVEEVEVGLIEATAA